MSFADPQSVTVNAVATSLPRTSSGVNSGTFSSSDGAMQLSVAHAYGKRTRRTIRLNQSKIASDPLITTQNVRLSTTVSLVVDAPAVGFTNTELKQLVDGFIATLSATSGAKISQLLGGEN